MSATFPISAISQDYFITPGQEWIFGVRVQEDGVRQFQVLENGKGSVFPNETKSDQGLHFEDTLSDLSSTETMMSEALRSRLVQSVTRGKWRVLGSQAVPAYND